MPESPRATVLPDGQHWPVLINNFYFPFGDVGGPAVFGEAHKIQIVASLCRKKRNAIQAGGHVGVFAVALIRAGFSQVLTFEPGLDTRACLNANLWRHRVADKVIVEPFALYSRWRRIWLKTPGDGAQCNSGAAQLTEDDLGANAVETCILDTHLNASECDLLYLDIEGSEYQALQGATKLLKEQRPVVVLENKGLIKEFAGDAPPLEPSPGLRAYMTELGYRLHTRLMRDDVFVPNEYEVPVCPSPTYTLSSEPVY